MESFIEHLQTTDPVAGIALEQLILQPKVKASEIPDLMAIHFGVTLPGDAEEMAIEDRARIAYEASLKPSV